MIILCDCQFSLSNHLSFQRHVEFFILISPLIVWRQIVISVMLHFTITDTITLLCPWQFPVCRLSFPIFTKSFWDDLCYTVHENWFGPAFMESDKMDQLSLNLVHITRYGPPFSTFAKNHSFFKFLLFWYQKLSKFYTIFILFYFRTLKYQTRDS